MRHIPTERWSLVRENSLIMELRCETCGDLVKVAKGASMIALRDHACSIMEQRKPSVKAGAVPLPPARGRKRA